MQCRQCRCTGTNAVDAVIQLIDRVAQHTDVVAVVDDSLICLPQLTHVHGIGSVLAVSHVGNRRAAFMCFFIVRRAAKGNAALIDRSIFVAVVLDSAFCSCLQLIFRSCLTGYDIIGIPGLVGQAVDRTGMRTVFVGSVNRNAACRERTGADIAAGRNRPFTAGNGNAAVLTFFTA